MASVFDVLDEIRRRPGLYIGGDEFQRTLQLQNLEQLLCGYSLALRCHKIQERVRDFNREFEEYLREMKGWSVSCGPIVAVCEASRSGEEAWELFWTLVDDFRSTVQLS